MRRRPVAKSLLALLAIALANGLLYVFLVPPWQHYDEPGHFEYAWLLAHRPGVPAEDDYDQRMRRAVAESMIANGFFRDMGFLPDLYPSEGPIWIGIPQVGDPLLYYWTVSIPLRALTEWDAGSQLMAARLVSLAYFLLTILAAWGLVRECVPEGHPLRWMVPFGIALLPSFADLMTAVNNDVGAVAAFSWFLWAAVRIIQRGLNGPRLLAAAGLAAACVCTKSTVYLAVPLLGLAVVAGLFRNRLAWIPWAGLAALTLLALAASVFWGDAWAWVRESNVLQESPTRVAAPDTPLGDWALQIQAVPGEQPTAVFQIIPQDRMVLIRGKTISFGAWVWASKPGTVCSLLLLDGKNYYSRRVVADGQPIYAAFTLVIPDDAARLEFSLRTHVSSGQPESIVWFDGIAMVEGERPPNEPPQFTSADAEQGVWGGRPFTNLVRNGSAETATLGFRPWLQAASQALSGAIPSPFLIAESVTDWDVSAWYYRSTAEFLLRTFWAKFGWNHVTIRLPFTGKPYQILAAVTLIGLAGAGCGLWRWRHRLPWRTLLFLGVAMAGVWGQTIFRGVSAIVPEYSGIPVARYAFPAIGPTMLLLSGGWLALGGPLVRCVHLPRRAGFLLHGAFFVILNAVSLSSIISYYQG